MQSARRDQRRQLMKARRVKKRPKTSLLLPVGHFPPKSREKQIRLTRKNKRKQIRTTRVKIKKRTGFIPVFFYQKSEAAHERQGKGKKTRLKMIKNAIVAGSLAVSIAQVGLRHRKKPLCRDEREVPKPLAMACWKQKAGRLFILHHRHKDAAFLDPWHWPLVWKRPPLPPQFGRQIPHRRRHRPGGR